MTEVAPSLSTAQTEAFFEFDQYQASEVKQRSYLQPHDNNNKDKVRELLRGYYCIDELTEYLKNRYQKITLQFPDALVCDSSYVVQMLQENLSASIGQNGNADNTEEYEKKLKLSEINFNSDYESDDEDCATCMNCSCGKKDHLEGEDHSSDKKHRKKHTKKKIDHYEVWVLADTSYSPCCIDEVAAEHVGADVVVHFGDSCLTPIQKLPSIYVFGKPYLSIQTFVDSFKKQYPDKGEKVVLMADTAYSYCLSDFYAELKKEYPNIAYSEVNNQHKSMKIIGYKELKEQKGINFGNRTLIGLDTLDYSLAEKWYSNYDDEANEELNSLLQEYQLFHITLPQSPRLLFLTTKFSSVAIFDPKTKEVNCGPFPSLMRRYRYMHVARTAGTIGILVNTLSLDNTKKMINIVAKWIKNADKKYYMFVVGKPNVAKLANFEVIDIWCILGCGQSGIIVDETNEYYKPIITPYELYLALSPEVTWTGRWITEFNDIIKMHKENFDDDNKSADNKDKDETSSKNNESANSGDEDRFSDEDYAPEFNAVTGKYVSNSRPLRQVKHLQIELNPQEGSASGGDQKKADANGNEQNQLVQKFSQSVVLKGDVSTSAIHLQNRHWTGLGSDYKDDDYDESGAVVEEGRAGIARGYDFDRETHAQ